MIWPLRVLALLQLNDSFVGKSVHNDDSSIKDFKFKAVDYCEHLSMPQRFDRVVQRIYKVYKRVLVIFS